MKVLIIDDEAPARRRLRRLLDAIDGVEVIGEAATSLEALAAVERARPDLLLLDIHMPGLDGLSLAARYAHLPPVIFVTAHDEHALRAFEVHAVDYLLKPVRPARLAAAIDRARALVRPAADAFRALASPASASPRVVTHDRGAVRLFDARAITRFRAESKYTAFLAEGGEHLTEEPLSALEARLAAHGFVRVHRAELVRVSAIRELRVDDGVHLIALDDGQTAAVSRRLAATLKQDLARLQRG